MANDGWGHSLARAAKFCFLSCLLFKAEPHASTWKMESMGVRVESLDSFICSSSQCSHNE